MTNLTFHHLTDTTDLLRPGYEFLCGRNDVLCRRENRRPAGLFLNHQHIEKWLCRERTPTDYSMTSF